MAPLTDEVAVRRRSSARAEATERRQRQILVAAEAAFAEHGFAASLRDIAQRAGITHQGLVHHYPDKTALLEAVLDDRTATAAADYQLESADPVTLFRGLLGIAERDVADLVRMRMYYRLCAEATAPTNPAHGYQRRWYAAVRDNLTRALSTMQERGRYRAAVPPEIGAVHLTAVRDGLVLQHLLDPDAIDLVAQLRTHLALYVDLGPEEGRPGSDG